MFGSLETFLFNNGVSQQVMDVLGGKVGLGSAESLLPKSVAGTLETVKKIFDFDLSAAKLSSNLSIEFKPANEGATPIH